MVRQIFFTLTCSPYRSTAFRVALVVGSVLFTINHGQALVKGKMTQGRWISGILTYCVPYSVSLHGQHQSRKRDRPTSS